MNTYSFLNVSVFKPLVQRARQVPYCVCHERFVQTILRISPGMWRTVRDGIVRTSSTLAQEVVERMGGGGGGTPQRYKMGKTDYRGYSYHSHSEKHVIT